MATEGSGKHESAGSGVSRLDRRRFLASVGAGAAATSVAGCLGGLTGGGEPIKIGAVYLLSGIAEALGAASESAGRLAVKQINDEGGIDGRDVEIFYRDHNLGDATQQVRSLVQEENVDAMIGMTSSGVTLNTAPLIEQLGVPFTLTDIGTPWITEFDTDTYPDKARGIPNLFRTNANTSINTYAMARFAMEELDVTRVANIGPNYAYGTQCWDYFKAYADGLGAGFDYVESVFPDLGATDMTPEINQVMAADPDLVFTSFWAGDTVTFVQQAAERGLFDQVTDVFDTLGADPSTFKALGGAMPEGVHFSSWYWHSAFDNPQNDAFLEAYREEYEDDDNVVNIPSIAGPSAYATPWIYKRAIEESGGTDPQGIIDAMEGMTFDAPDGTWTLDPDSHQADAPTVIGEVSSDDDVPYDGPGLANAQTYRLDRETATDLLSGTDLPPGV